MEGYSQRDIARINGLSKSNLNRQVHEIRAPFPACSNTIPDR